MYLSMLVSNKYECLYLFIWLPLPCLFIDIYLEFDTNYITFLPDYMSKETTTVVLSLYF